MSIDKFMRNVNKIVKGERGDEVSENDALLKAGIDSFSWLMFWLELDKLYPGAFSDEWVSGIEYDKVKFIDLYDHLKEAANG